MQQGVRGTGPDTEEPRAADRTAAARSYPEHAHTELRALVTTLTEIRDLIRFGSCLDGAIRTLMRPLIQPPPGP